MVGPQPPACGREIKITLAGAPANVTWPCDVSADHNKTPVSGGAVSGARAVVRGLGGRSPRRTLTVGRRHRLIDVATDSWREAAAAAARARLPAVCGCTRAPARSIGSVLLVSERDDIVMSPLGDIYSFASWQNRHFGGVFRP